MFCLKKSYCLPTLQSLDTSLNTQPLIEILEGLTWLNTQFFLKGFLTGLILAQRCDSFALARIAAHQTIMGFFQTGIETQYMTKMRGTLIPTFSVPGYLGKFVTRLQVSATQIIAPDGAPITVECLPVVAAI